MYQKMIHRKTSKKGFTLVEVIVVLVILAILAAIMIPSMTKWIDKARDKSILVEARSALLAAQTLASEEYAKATPAYATAVTDATCKALALYTGAASDFEFGGNGEVTKLTYTVGGKSTTYTSAGGWTDPA